MSKKVFNLVVGISGGIATILNLDKPYNERAKPLNDAQIGASFI